MPIITPTRRGPPWTVQAPYLHITVKFPKKHLWEEGNTAFHEQRNGLLGSGGARTDLRLCDSEALAHPLQELRLQHMDPLNCTKASVGCAPGNQHPGCKRVLLNTPTPSWLFRKHRF